jgi:uncharacterized protein (DUF2267 family)
MITSTEMFAAHVAAHAGIAPERAHEIARVVLGGLGTHLAPGPRELVADELPPGLRDALLADVGLAQPVDELVLAPGTTAAQAHELIASVCRVLVEELSIEAIAALRAALPVGLATLFEPSAEGAPLPTHTPELRQSGSLATARPGSQHPVSEAQPARIQHESVAAANPHATGKLSSNEPEDRSRETLAAGRPGSSRPVSNTRS